jgi:sporulation protein YlmC with PRC-barrel domain
MFTVADRDGEIGAREGTPEAGATSDAGAGTPAVTEAAGTAEATTAAGTAEPAGTTAAGTETAGEAESDMLLVRGTELIGSEIVDMNGDTVGMVEEVLVDETGAIQYIVFDASTFMTGTGETGTGTGAQTPEAGATSEAGATTETGATAEATTAAGTPEAVGTVSEGTQVVDEAIEGTGALADEDTILVFNGTASDLETQAIMLTDELLSADGVAFMPTGTDQPADVMQLEGLLRVSRITETVVMNAQDEELGEVSEWIVDLQQGMVQYGVVDFGGFLGLAENNVAVPWEQFTVNAGAEADASLMLDVTEDTLQNAPQLNMGEWEAWPNPIPTDWETETRTFWETAS